MAERSVANDFGSLVLGGAVGFGLVMLITGLGFGGRGDGSGHRGDAALPMDADRLNFVLTAKGLELRDAAWKPTVPPKIFMIDAAIWRVSAGGRSDVGLKIAGDVRQGDVTAALDAFKRAGIAVWKAAPQPAAVAGNARGAYGTGGAS